MSESMKSAGFGDGSEPDKFGAYRCRHTVNITHPHLGGDFICRDVNGDSVIMDRENYVALLSQLDLAHAAAKGKE